MEEKVIIEKYLNGSGMESLAKEFHVGKNRIKQILLNNNIQLKSRGGIKMPTSYLVSDWHIEKYPLVPGFHYEAVYRSDGKTFNDYMNEGGYLTSYIAEKENIAIPTLYDRRKYYMTTGNYWWEQWFEIKLVQDSPVKKCPYCNWLTKDVDNNSGRFEIHLLQAHNKTKYEYIEEFPEERSYFKVENATLNRQMETNTKKYVTCSICGKKFSRIDSKHLNTHNITKWEYIQKYHTPTYCSTYLDVLHSNCQKMNQSLDGRVDIFSSEAENEIRDYITSLGYKCEKNRSLLHGKELDIYIPEAKIAIEYNGNKFHTENFGHKDRQYHLSKTNECNASGITLIQIFEDEYQLHKDIVLSKIRHILKCDNNLPKIYARKCEIKEICNIEAQTFLEKYHIQGYAKSSVYLGCLYKNQLVGVMTFKKDGNNGWELNRFASDYHYICCGVGGKLLKYFIEKYHPIIIKSFADRRWSMHTDSNLYVKLGFKFDGYLYPDYRYYNSSVDKYKRFHKFGFRKNILHKEYGLPLSMTESEMTQTLGYDRIWDCGLIKYIWKS